MTLSPVLVRYECKNCGIFTKSFSPMAPYPRYSPCLACKSNSPLYFENKIRKEDFQKDQVRKAGLDMISAADYLESKDTVNAAKRLRRAGEYFKQLP
ncbi:hypothetical protein DDN55_10560 [Vibrio cholerae]|uniref:hypothetical protein n=1 Tax=Vibrio cholerae TaxID=666 RepID=UPI001A35DF86|nr:hypothetical protein [Vibrio cholerae]EGR2433906.1 hypothetical protein [Vibrio cholerae]EGR4209411.1 hypothetical protein [Vibrio cholerae]EHD2270045.1 hypothetical protein [Vibrio cholerae]EKF9881534.1 hypothetical protein [Vibrio cholerae]ELL7124020.1 hypothetical protein [Vibrio cholerae]